MRLISTLVLACLFAFAIPAYAKRVHNKMSNCTFLYGSREKAMKELVKSWDTLHVAPGEHVADIGAKGANMGGVLSMFYPDLDMTLEDIDSGCLNDRQLAFVLDYYSGINDGKKPQRFTCRVVIGNDSSTTLPDAAFQKVFFINTYHEVTKPKQMLADLYRIVAPGGMLYAQERVTEQKRLHRKDCGHLMPVESEFLKAFNDAGFVLVKKKVTESSRKKGDHVRSTWYQFRKA